jgi:hypothetical protein
MVGKGVTDESMRTHVVVPHEENAHRDSLRELPSDRCPRA